MKKTISLILSVLLVLPLVFLSASAQGKGRVALIWEEAELSRGDLFSVLMECNRNPGFSSLLVNVEFDARVLEVFSVEDLGLFPGFSYDAVEGSGKLVLRWKSSEVSGNVTSVGYPAKIMFRVKNDALLVPTSVDVQINERFFDAQAADGTAVPFETEGFLLPLECLHVNEKTEVIVAPTFEMAGEGKKTCLDCGREESIGVLPSVISSDGSTVAELEPGVFSETDEKEVQTEFLYGGEEYEEAKRLFGSDVVRVFRVSFSKNGSKFYPAGNHPVYLTVGFDLPEPFALYVLTDDGKEKKEVSFENGILSFGYSSKTFVLTASKEAPTPSTTVFPSVPEETQSEPSSSVLPVDDGRRADMLIILGAVVLTLLFGFLLIFLLRHPKRF